MFFSKKEDTNGFEELTELAASLIGQRYRICLECPRYRICGRTKEDCKKNLLEIAWNRVLRKRGKIK